MIHLHVMKRPGAGAPGPLDLPAMNLRDRFSQLDNPICSVHASPGPSCFRRPFIPPSIRPGSSAPPGSRIDQWRQRPASSGPVKSNHPATMPPAGQPPGIVPAPTPPHPAPLKRRIRPEGGPCLPHGLPKSPTRQSPARLQRPKSPHTIHWQGRFSEPLRARDPAPAALVYHRHPACGHFHRHPNRPPRAGPARRAVPACRTDCQSPRPSPPTNGHFPRHDAQFPSPHAPARPEGGPCLPHGLPKSTTKNTPARQPRTKGLSRYRNRYRNRNRNFPAPAAPQAREGRLPRAMAIQGGLPFRLSIAISIAIPIAIPMGKRIQIEIGIAIQIENSWPWDTKS
jgi:hypothetical protein